MTNLAKITRLQLIANSMLSATKVVLQADTLAEPAERKIIAAELFALLPISALQSRVGQPGFEQAEAIITCINDARVAFEQDNATAIRVTTTFIDNDFNGNDVTACEMRFQAGDQQVLWKTTLTELRDDNECTTEAVLDASAHQFLFNGEAVSDKFREFLLSELQEAAESYVTQNLIFPVYPEAEELASAQALIAPYLGAATEPQPGQELYLVSLNIRIGDAVKYKDKLVYATDESGACRLAIETDCHQDINDDSWEDGSVYDLHGEICYSVKKCQRILPEHAPVLLSYMTVSI